MSEDGKGILGNWDASDEEIRQAMGHAIAAALREHKRAGHSIVVWDRVNKRSVIVPPEDIKVRTEVDLQPSQVGDGS